MNLNYITTASEQEIAKITVLAFAVIDAVQCQTKERQLAALAIVFAALIKELKVDPRETMTVIETVFNRAQVDGNPHAKALANYVREELKK